MAQQKSPPSEEGGYSAGGYSAGGYSAGGCG